MTPDRIVRWVIENFEGFAYTDDPIDTGGATKFGVTQRTYAYWRRKYRGIYSTTKTDVRAMTLDVAIEVGLDVFMRETLVYDIVAQRTQLIVYDFGYHSGIETAVSALQRALVSVGEAVTVDGTLGPKTIVSVNKIGRDDVVLSMLVLTEREEFMQRIMETKHTQRKYMLGWWRRTTRLQRELLRR